MATKKKTGKCPASGCIKKVGGNYRIVIIFVS